MNFNEVRGIIPPIVTPVDKNEQLEVAGFKNVIDHVIDGGVHGAFVMGSNGEFYGFDHESQKKVIEVAVEHVNHRVPVYAGTTALTTKESIKLALQAEAIGADALSIMTPFFIQPNEEELYQHYSAIAKATRLPILLYNNPDKTNNNISVKLLKRLAEIDNIWGIKNTTLDFAQTINYINATKEIKEFTVLSGSDYYIFATLAYGGKGAVAGTANVAPRLVSDIYEKFMQGDYAAAMKAQMDLVPLRNTYSYGSFPVVMKDCLNLLGIDVGEPIRPISHCSTEKMEELKKVLTSIHLL